MRRLKASTSTSGEGYPRYRVFWSSLGLLLSVGAPATSLADASLPQPATEKRPDPVAQEQPQPQRLQVQIQKPGGMPVPQPIQPDPSPRSQPQPRAMPRTGGVKPRTKPYPSKIMGTLGMLHPHAPHEPCLVGGQVLITLRTPARPGDPEV